MDIAELITPAAVVPRLRVSSKKQLLQEIARRAAELVRLHERQIFDDLVFLLLAPESAGADHLKALARVSRLLRDRQVCEKLRGAEHPDAIYALLTEPQASHHAA